MQMQTVILKADDVRFDPEHVLPPRWQRFIAFIEAREVAAGLGLIGNTLEDASDEFCDRMRALDASGRFEIWNHGYDHALNRERPDGSIWSEFYDMPLAHQADHLLKTQALSKERLGITLRTFGAPGNKIDARTRVAVEACEDIRVWLYGDPEFARVNLRRVINAEYPVHNPDYAAFATHHREDIAPLVLQLHPNSWDDGRFTEFTKIVDHLVDAGAAFRTPIAWALANTEAT